MCIRSPSSFNESHRSVSRPEWAKKGLWLYIERCHHRWDEREGGREKKLPHHHCPSSLLLHSCSRASAYVSLKE